MHFLRLLRIFIPLLLIAAIVAGAALVLSSRSDLRTARQDVDNAWKPLRSALDTRYGTLATADNAVRATPGPLHQLVTDIDNADANWRTLESTGGSVAAQVSAANELEALGRQLVLTAHRRRAWPATPTRSPRSTPTRTRRRPRPTLRRSTPR